MHNPIALTFVTYNALQQCLYAKQTRGGSQIKLPSEGHRAIGGDRSYSMGHRLEVI